MAFTDNTRIDNYHQKKDDCKAIIRVSEAEYTEFLAAGNFKVALLPPRAVITDAYVHTFVASDALGVTVGTTEGGTEVLSLGDTATLGKTGTFTGQSHTGTGVPLFMTVAAGVTVGDFIVVVEYCEYTKNTGEYTKISRNFDV